MLIKSTRIIATGIKNSPILMQIWNEKAKIIKIKSYVEMNKDVD